MLNAGRPRPCPDAFLLVPGLRSGSRKTKRKPQVGDTQTSPGRRRPTLDAPAVDPGPIGAAQVANEDLAVADGQAAVATGYPRRVEADLASPIAADECQRLIETEGGVPVQRDEARGMTRTVSQGGAKVSRGGTRSRSSSHAPTCEVASPRNQTCAADRDGDTGFHKSVSIMGESARSWRRLRAGESRAPAWKSTTCRRAPGPRMAMGSTDVPSRSQRRASSACPSW